MEVRDTDCDVQGIVANHVYVEYLAHARHLFLKALGYDLKSLHEQGIEAVVESIKIDFKAPLLPFETFTVETGLGFKGMFRSIFPQRIVRDSDKTLVVEATVTCATVTADGPVEPTGLSAAFDAYVQKHS